MGLLEWLLEKNNPGPRGHADLGIQKKPIGEMANWLKLLMLFAGSAFWVGFIVALTSVKGKSLAFLFLFTPIYLVAALFIHPKANTQNMGWGGGLIDNPFRWSDDINRFLLFFEALLLPGKLMIMSIRIIFFFVRNM